MFFLARVFVSAIAFFALSVFAVAQTALATPDSYVISIGDELELDILDDSDPPERFVVGGDGEVQLPYIGGLRVVSVRVADAREAVRQAYVEREIFVDPKVELSIANFRPISVLGDVRTPGNYPFQPFMTAEQAVGLAGGPTTSANNEEARVLERRNLEGSLRSLDFDLALSAAQFARVQAQLAGDGALSISALPQSLQPAINTALFDEHKEDENRIIALDARDQKTRRGLLEEAIEEAEKRIEYLNTREALQTKQVERFEAEIERSRGLLERGLVPQSSLAESERLTSEAESDLLLLREQRSAAIVQAAGLRGDLSRLDADRERVLRTEAQIYLNDVKKIASDRASIEDRVRLLEQWMNAASGLDTQILVEYRVRRRSEAGIKTEIIDAYGELLPGDMLVVAIKPPEALQVTE